MLLSKSSKYGSGRSSGYGSNIHKTVFNVYKKKYVSEEE
jgi:hypothetical protein